MSKTFKNAHTVHGKMTVREDGGCVSVSVNMDSPSDTIIHISPSDAPALALAVLEAAGFEDSSSGGHITGARIAVGDLKRHVKMQERATAEAKEQAELEAEALELCNEFIEDMGYDRVDSWDGSVPSKKEAWLAVARRAREIAKEATK